MDFKKETSNDLGGSPEVLNIRSEVCRNTNFRSTLWTGEHLQVTLMCIPVGGEVGLEFHEDVDQLLQIESGYARVYMGRSKQSVKCLGVADRNSAIIVPAGTWHNIVNVYNAPLKLYSVYAPPEHPFGTLHRTKADADLQGD